MDSTRILIRTSPAFGSGFGISACSKTSTGSPKLRWIILRMMSPIHNHDVWTVRGSYGYKPTLPAIGGSEAVGIASPAFGSGFGISACSKTSTGSPKLRWIILRMLYSAMVRCCFTYKIVARQSTSTSSFRNDSTTLKTDRGIKHAKYLELILLVALL
jgi:hypothetical protein